jgi:glycosyltransferase involved in cell wall biosynthesis
MRAATDVVEPFNVRAEDLTSLLARLARLRLRDGDTITVADNTREGVAAHAAPAPGIRIVGVPERQSSYYARNRGAAVGAAPWLVFIDADVVPPPELLDRYLARTPADDVAVLVGGVRDVAGDDETLVGRYARLSRLLDQSNTLRPGWPYAQTANCAVRRTAFDDVNGFVDDIRSGGDADLCFRLRERGWRLETRTEATVEHRSRSRLSGLLAQRTRHGSGAQWLTDRYPGFVAARPSWPGLVGRVLSGVLRSGIAIARGDRDEALIRALNPLTRLAFEIGRSVPNSVLRDRGVLRELLASVLR